MTRRRVSNAAYARGADFAADSTFTLGSCRDRARRRLGFAEFLRAWTDEFAGWPDEILDAGDEEAGGTCVKRPTGRGSRATVGASSSPSCTGSPADRSSIDGITSNPLMPSKPAGLRERRARRYRPPTRALYLTRENFRGGALVRRLTGPPTRLLQQPPEEAWTPSSSPLPSPEGAVHPSTLRVP